MKYKIMFFTLMIICVLCGCSEHKDSSSMSIQLNTESQVSTVSNEKEDTVSEESESQVISSQNNTSVILKEEKRIKSYDTENSKQKNKEEKSKVNIPDKSGTASKDTASINTVTEIAETSSESIHSTEQNATKADEKTIAAKMVEYINKYRNEQGKSSATTLPRLTEYAEYRSRQLIKNFAHDSSDETKAATELKYGEYVDPQIFGISGEPYYRASVREAIMKGGYIGPVDVIAEKLALLTKSSSGHWSYVGSDEYMYIGIGVTYENGIWYSNISVSTTAKYN